MPRACGISITPQLVDSIINVSAMLDHPPSPVMTTEYDVAFSRLTKPDDRDPPLVRDETAVS
jgi:hypothetical protein